MGSETPREAASQADLQLPCFRQALTSRPPKRGLRVLSRMRREGRPGQPLHTINKEIDMAGQKPAVRPTAWRNSNLSPKEARKKGLCGACGGHGRFTQVINGKQTLVICNSSQH